MSRQRILLIPLLAWALIMIVPDLLRVVQPLGSYGFYANNDGLIYDVTGPFDEISQSPAWQAGIREGDLLDLSRLRCIPYARQECSDAFALLGGKELVLPGRKATLDLLATDEHPARDVSLLARSVPANPFERFVVALAQLAGILVVTAAAWLVWTRPGPMSWGFFLYVMWFNPGQVYAYYALLQQSPPLLLAQYSLESIAEAAGYAGLILFVLRVPTDAPDPKWRWLERALPGLGVLLFALLLEAYCVFPGSRSEEGARIGILVGFVVAVTAVLLLLERTKRLPPEEYQRLRWVLWGSLIGLPAFLIAELGSTTSFFETPWGDFTPSEDALGLLYLINGILCLFVFEAIRRERVVSVSIPLRRVTVLGLTLSLPALLLHHEVEYMQENLALPNWAWLVIGAIALYLISRLHEFATHITDRYFNRGLERMAAEVGQAILKAKRASDIDRLLTHAPFHALKLTSAAVFRQEDHVLRRSGSGLGWDDGTARTLSPDAPLLAPLASARPFAVPDPEEDAPELPRGLARPILAVPAANPLRCFALTFYGPHASGTDLDSYERALLGRIAQDAAAAYAELENRHLREKIGKLEQEFADMPPRAGARPTERL